MARHLGRGPMWQLQMGSNRERRSYSLALAFRLGFAAGFEIFSISFVKCSTARLGSEIMLRRYSRLRSVRRPTNSLESAPA